MQGGFAFIGDGSMSDELPYWKFMALKWIGGNIQAHDMTTQGIFINLCAMAWRDGGYVENNHGKLSRLLRVDKQTLASAIQLLLDDDLLVEKDGEGLSSKFILLQLDERNVLSSKRSKAGRKGGKAKQLNRRSNCQANVKQTPSILESESEKELEEESIYKHYPKKVGKSAAIKAIKAACKVKTIDAAHILERTKAFATATATWPDQDRQFIPNPATWYNQGQ